MLHIWSANKQWTQQQPHSELSESLHKKNSASNCPTWSEDEIEVTQRSREKDTAHEPGSLRYSTVAGRETSSAGFTALKYIISFTPTSAIRQSFG
jgi:hypothetical protein